jgi:hypothetical protein
LNQDNDNGTMLGGTKKDEVTFLEEKNKKEEKVVL